MKKLIALLLLFNCQIFADELLSYEEKIVALTLLGEARGEDKIGIYAVACVIQERALQRSLTPRRVCHEPLHRQKKKYQFSCWNGIESVRDAEKWFSPSFDKNGTLVPNPIDLYARGLARKIVKGEKLDRKKVNFATHFLNKRLMGKISWTKGRKPVKIIGNHAFYKLD